MKLISLNITASALLPAALLALASCSSDSPKPPEPTAQTTSAAAIQRGVPGGVVVETHTITANVTRIDSESREVTLAIPGGEKTTVQCGPEVANFDQIHVGDQLKVTVTEEAAVYMAEEGAPPSSGGAAMVALAPKGAKPGGVMAATKQLTATVVALDLKQHKATLQFADGTTRKVAVREDVDLTQRKVGEKVVIRTTQAVAISMEKPQPAAGSGK
jgi:hypothetical protein